MPKDSSENLIPFDERTKSEQREIAKKGGKASGESRRKRKAEKDRFLIMERLRIQDATVIEKLIESGIDNSELHDMEMLRVFAIYEKAVDGDIQANRYIDERTNKNPQLKVKERELELKEKAIEKEKAADIVTKVVIFSGENELED